MAIRLLNGFALGLGLDLGAPSFIHPGRTALCGDFILAKTRLEPRPAASSPLIDHLNFPSFLSLPFPLPSCSFIPTPPSPPASHHPRSNLGQFHPEHTNSKGPLRRPSCFVCSHTHTHTPLLLCPASLRKSQRTTHSSCHRRKVPLPHPFVSSRIASKIRLRMRRVHHVARTSFRAP
jgi:hypothetical protein